MNDQEKQYSYDDEELDELLFKTVNPAEEQSLGSIPSRCEPGSEEDLSVNITNTVTEDVGSSTSIRKRDKKYEEKKHSSSQRSKASRTEKQSSSRDQNSANDDQ